MILYILGVATKVEEFHFRYEPRDNNKTHTGYYKITIH